MNAWLTFYPGDDAAALAITILAQTAGLVLLGLLVSRTLVGRDPAARYGVWLCTLVCVPLGALAVWGFQRTGITLVGLPWLPPVAVADALLPSAEEPPSAAGGLFVVWLAGALFLAVRLLWGWRLLASLRRQLQPIDPERLDEVAPSVCRTLTVASLPAVMTSRCVGSPVSMGILHPVVVLPAGLIATLDRRQLHDVLVHECAHFLKRDHVVALLQRLVQIVFWPHPLIYLLYRELARAREEVCDNYVLRNGDVPCYARTLLAISERSGTGRPALAAIGILQPRPRLERRVAGLLDTRRKLVTRIHRPTVAAAALGLLVAASTIAGTRLVHAPAVDEQAELPDADNDRSPMPVPLVLPDADRPLERGQSHFRRTKIGTVPHPSGERLDVALTEPSRPVVVRMPLVPQDFEAAVRLPSQPQPGFPQPAIRATGALEPVADAHGRGVVAESHREANERAPVLPADPTSGDLAQIDGQPQAPGAAQPLSAATSDVLAALQPMMRVQTSRMSYVVTLRLAGDVESSVAVEPGRPGKLHLEEGVHQKLTLEVLVAPAETAEQVTASYRLTLQTDPETYYEWQAQRVELRLETWTPLAPDRVDLLPKPPVRYGETVATPGASIARFRRMLQERFCELENESLSEILRILAPAKSAGPQE